MSPKNAQARNASHNSAENEASSGGYGDNSGGLTGCAASNTKATALIENQHPRIANTRNSSKYQEYQEVDSQYEDIDSSEPEPEEDENWQPTNATIAKIGHKRPRTGTGEGEMPTPKKPRQQRVKSDAQDSRFDWKEVAKEGGRLQRVLTKLFEDNEKLKQEKTDLKKTNTTLERAKKKLTADVHAKERQLFESDQKADAMGNELRTAQVHNARLRKQVAECLANGIPDTGNNSKTSDNEIVGRWEQLRYNIHNLVVQFLEVQDDLFIHLFADHRDPPALIRLQQRCRVCPKLSHIYFEAHIWQSILSDIFLAGQPSWCGRLGRDLAAMTQLDGMSISIWPSYEHDKDTNVRGFRKKRCQNLGGSQSN